MAALIWVELVRASLNTICYRRIYGSIVRCIHILNIAYHCITFSIDWWSMKQEEKFPYFVITKPKGYNTKSGRKYKGFRDPKSALIYAKKHRDILLYSGHIVINKNTCFMYKIRE